MISNILFIIGMIFMFIGVIGMQRFNTFYKRLMASTLIDTAGFLSILLALIFRLGFNAISAKILLLFFTVLVINPIFTHMIIQFSWKSGNKEDVKKES
ncbi:MAG: monovalent cation/H(+) antiporter subunit G [Tissierellia bacterium]|nr:monovalent cation/H(+) antiporter subunit G [Tissierellia bacterium]